MTLLTYSEIRVRNDWPIFKTNMNKKLLYLFEQKSS